MFKARWLALLAAGMVLFAVTANAQVSQSIIGCLRSQTCEEPQKRADVTVGLFGPILPQQATGPPLKASSGCLIEDLCKGVEKPASEVRGSILLYSAVPGVQIGGNQIYAPLAPRQEFTCNIFGECKVKPGPVAIAPEPIVRPNLLSFDPLRAYYWQQQQAAKKAAEEVDPTNSQSRPMVQVPVSRTRASQQASQAARNPGPPVSRARQQIESARNPLPPSGRK